MTLIIKNLIFFCNGILYSLSVLISITMSQSPIAFFNPLLNAIRALDAVRQEEFIKAVKTTVQRVFQDSVKLSPSMLIRLAEKVKNFETTLDVGVSFAKVKPCCETIINTLDALPKDNPSVLSAVADAFAPQLTELLFAEEANNHFSTWTQEIVVEFLEILVSEPIKELKVECVSTSSQVEEAKPQETNNVESYANVVGENSTQQFQVQAGSSSSAPVEVVPTPQEQDGWSTIRSRRATRSQQETLPDNLRINGKFLPKILRLIGLFKDSNGEISNDVPNILDIPKEYFSIKAEEVSNKRPKYGERIDRVWDLFVNDSRNNQGYRIVDQAELVRIRNHINSERPNEPIAWIVSRSNSEKEIN